MLESRPKQRSQTGLRTILVTVLVVSITLLQCATVHAKESKLSRLTKESFEEVGPYSVKEIEHPELVDEARGGRKVPLKVFLPTNARPGEAFPLVIFSHGGGGHWDANMVQSQHLASHGYVVIAPTHVDSSNLKLRYYMSRAGGRMSFGKAIHRLTVDADASLERPGDVTFAIDTALKWNQSDPDLRGHIQPDNIGMIGHSFGAYTTQVICGARPRVDNLIPGSKQLPKSPVEGLADPRVKAGVALSPQGPGTVCFDKTSFASIDRPMLWITGTKDTQKKHDGTLMSQEARREGFALMPAGNKYLLWLENADHMGFSHNPKLKFDLIPSPARPDMQRIAKAMTVVFFDTYLKESSTAKKSLNQQFASSLCGGLVPKAEFTAK